MDGKQIFFFEVQPEELRPLVELGFGEDPDLLEKYQQLPTKLEDTVQRNIDHIFEASRVYNFVYYKVMWGDEVIGFVVMDFIQKLLFSFGINIRFRKKEIVMACFEKVNEFFEGIFGCILWVQNERAINFLRRQGMEVFEKSEIAVFLIKK